MRIPILSALFPPEKSDAIVDFLPVNGDAELLAGKLAAAKERHGKPFASDVRKARETEHSRDLRDLNDASDETARKVESDRQAHILKVRPMVRGAR